ncbi:branched-chain amino acid ABC transporter permease [Luteolibacter ambystomatis]|uniref:Branched-chain amino acid ABC transporter permease n=1 Tax=Luteolibacter ambystomatis TaxID=2824561 RepID=A0A975G8K3_9BACT|nr:branched-chain amino acid ABC transporter permease [Luteolibacter ambystomatis]QUE50741.1 branched-chain amino acid ABC transporter permease [Luteolibacter ambystomatis]
MDFIQQAINGLGLGAIYALIALGYTMVYGVLRFINFAHSDVLMLGAFAAFYLAPRMQQVFGQQSVFGVIMLFIAVALICALIGMTIERFAYRPLRHRPKLAVLITAIGVSLFIEFTCQNPHVFGAATRPFPKLVAETQFHLGNAIIGSTDILVIVVTAVLLGAMWFIVQKTRIGTAMRAVSFNQQAALLMGVPVNKIISFTFGLGSSLAAIAGILYSMKAPGIEPLMGVQPGLRAFVAAVLGGIGNLPGAVLGAVLLGLLETFAGGVPGLSNYRDAIAFGILILILLLKPAGLLGRATIEKV